MSWGTLQSLEQRQALVLPAAHRTLSGAQANSHHELAALGFFPESLRYNSPECPVCTEHVRQANGATVNCAQWSTAVNSAQCRSQKSEL
jgi:hypothetical protein